MINGKDTNIKRILNFDQGERKLLKKLNSILFLFLIAFISNLTLYPQKTR